MLGFEENLPDVRVLLAHPNHHTLMTRPTNYRGENSTRGIVTSEASFTHARTVVNNESGNLILHGG
jgi:hypothetical protein